MTDRLKFLREQYGVALVNAFLADNRNAPFTAWLADLDGSPEDDEAAADALFSRYRGADPTRTGACMQWLIRLALAGGLPLEDLPKAHETLEAFQTYKRRLPAEQRDLGRYESLGAVWAATEPFVLADAPVSGKDEERREREAARAESDILLEQDGWTVAIPRTERAACWWGRGTRWCTAAAQNNMFCHYDPDGPLVVFVRPDGAKFQWHGPTQQFMDARDTCVHESSVRGVIDAAASAMPYGLDHEYTDPLDKNALLKAILASMFTNEPLEEDPAVITWGQAAFSVALHELGIPLIAVPKGHRDYELCLKAVGKDRGALICVPEEIQDKSLCMAAVRRYGRSIKHVRKDLLDRDLCMAAVSDLGGVLSDIPESHREYDLCVAAVRKSGRALRHVPPGILNREIYLEAISADGSALRFVDHAFIDKDMCLTAVRNCGTALKHVPRKLIDREICLAAVRNDGMAVEHVPHEFRDKEMHFEAVRQDGYALDRIRTSDMDLDICRAAVGHSRDFLHHIPEEFADVIRAEIADDREVEDENSALSPG